MILSNTDENGQGIVL